MTSPLESMPEQIGLAVEQITAEADRLGLEWKLRPGTVTVGTTATVNSVLVTLDGDTAPTNGLSLVGICSATDRVMTLWIPPEGLYVIGFLTGAPLGSQRILRQGSLDSQSTTSGSYSNITSGAAAITFPFVKQRGSTRVELMMMGSGFASAAAAVIQTALLLNGVDYDLCFFFYNTANEHHSWAAARDDITGIPAGSYTITARWRRLVSGTINFDSNDLLTMKAKEVAAVIS